MLMLAFFMPSLTLFPKPTSALNLSNAITRSLTKYPAAVRRNASTNVAVAIPSPCPPPTSAYVHLPFCRKRCHYCDFPIVALGSASFNSDDDPRMVSYIELLCREIQATKLELSLSPLQTVFFGGGTPSLLPPRLVSTVLDTLNSKFGVCSDAEISMEMDPGTFDDNKLTELMGLGVNRVSLGVQAFQEELLKSCGRAHGLKEVHEAIEIVKSCGVNNWSLDLISSLPHQTLEMWVESLTLAVAAQPTHVSVYDLQVEQDTKFGVLYKPGEFPLPSENQSAELYRTASRMLTVAGYNHYEISSYCRSGFVCKHNFTYWENKPFFGFGLGSASYVNWERFSRPKKLKEYKTYVQNLEDGLVELRVDACADARSMAMDVVMLSLRTAKGLDMKSFGNSFGGKLIKSLCEVYKPYIESGHVLCLNGNGKKITVDEFVSLHKFVEQLASIRLSDPDGFLLSNELISLAFGVIDP